MNQKRLITILPLVFILCFVVLVLGFYFLNQGGAFSACGRNVRFQDEGLRLDFEYPCDWEIKLQSRFSEEPIENKKAGIFAPQVENYSIILQKGATRIIFEKILLSAEGSAKPIGSSKYDYKVLDEKVIRYKEKDSNKVFYANYVKCETLPNALRTSDPNTNDCASAFVENFGEYPTIVTLELNDQALQDEADRVVLEILK